MQGGLTWSLLGGYFICSDEKEDRSLSGYILDHGYLSVVSSVVLISTDKGVGVTDKPGNLTRSLVDLREARICLHSLEIGHFVALLGPASAFRCRRAF
jgi:hypothetical protein